MEPREGGSECVEKATSDDDCCNGIDTTGNCFNWKGEDEVG